MWALGHPAVCNPVMYKKRYVFSFPLNGSIAKHVICSKETMKYFNSTYRGKILLNMWLEVIFRCVKAHLLLFQRLFKNTKIVWVLVWYRKANTFHTCLTLQLNHHKDALPRWLLRKAIKQMINSIFLLAESSLSIFYGFSCCYIQCSRESSKSYVKTFSITFSGSMTAPPNGYIKNMLRNK